MATIHRDGDLDLLDGKVAVIGYGSQGHAHALNLQRLRRRRARRPARGKRVRAKAEEAGLKVGSVAEAVKGAQVVAILVPDHVQKEVWDADIAPNLEPGAAVLFAHGLNIHFERIAPPEGHDVIMVAPKAPGHRVRELYVSGAGTPGLVAIQQDASGQRARARARLRRRHRLRPRRVCSRRRSQRRPRAISSASRPCSAAASRRSSRPASTRSSRRATSRRSPTTSA